MDVHARILPTGIAVIGAGAAGLAAARTLKRRGEDVLVLEARSRIGGRAYTLRAPGGTFPIELGAEFVHGNSPAMAALLRESAARTSEVDGAPDAWEATERVLDAVDLDAADSSVDRFLKAHGGPDAQTARMLIEGFDAAITADASIHAIAREWRSDANQSQSRLRDGYGALLDHLARDVADALLLDTRVERIAWSNDGVRVYAERYGEGFEVHAKRAVVTLPAGVLRDLRFTPALPPRKRSALAAIAMGPVVKVVLQFRSVFWSDGFLDVPADAGFRTMWSRLPEQAPVLVAWAGGNAVGRLYELLPRPVDLALETCERMFPRVDVRGALQAARWHDWQEDPYARGAYSYLRVNGADARERLAEPVDGVLFFAGEATAGVYAGTVSGALESGIRAAEEAAAP